MKKRIAMLLACCLLAGCAAQAEPVSIPTEEASPAPTTASAPVSTETPAPKSPFGALPVTEKGIWDYYLYEEKGYYIIRGITPYEGDYLVELGRDYEGETLLVWIFGDTGRKVQMTTMGNRCETEIQSRGALRIRTVGDDTSSAWKGLPKTYRAVAPAEGDYAVKVEETTWLPPSQGVQIGLWDGDGMMYSERYEQLCDARITADGLSLSFIPNTDSMEKFQSFFPACTTIPSLETSYDEAAGTFTLRLYNTSLKSGEYARDMSAWIGAETGYEGLYPRTIPEGSLGADSLFLTGVEIHQDGDDAVITARLTERAGWFTVDSGNLGYDDIPWLTLRFREPDSMEVPEPVPTPGRGDLTEEQVEQVNRVFSVQENETGEADFLAVSGFFTSYYDDVRELDFLEFLWYYPSDGSLGEEDLEEFAALAELPGFPWKKEYFAESGLTPERLPVPTHRILRSSVDETLQKYAGITTADLKNTDNTLYLPDYDAYYTFTSDFGPGSFTCEGGRVTEDTAVLWSEERQGLRKELTLKKEGEDWHIQSFLQVPAEKSGESMS